VAVVKSHLFTRTSGWGPASTFLSGYIVPNIDQDLVAVTHFFATLGYEIHLRPQGPCEFSKVDEGGVLHSIPIRWDGTGKGFFLDIIVSDRTDLHELAGAYVLDLLDH
jgi:hypothetical protein